ncbi:MAG TPA: ABC transporter permease [Mycobacteriales bacterium]|jgi:peptide/nickel transport system permease protein|nr:ABC transporter permease [Mycobacteriales bacterium]
MTAPTTPQQLEPGAEREFTVQARSQWQMVSRRFFAHRLAMISLVVFVLVLAVAFIYPLFMKHPFDYQSDDLSVGPSSKHLFGTDSIGQDVFAQVLRGIQTSVKVSLLAMAVGEILGVFVGALAGFYRGWVDSLLMRAVDVVLTVPVLVLVLVLSRIAGGSWWMIALIIGGVTAAPTSRLVRSVFLSLREREYVEAARALGATDSRIIWRHLLPNSLGPIIVDATLAVAGAILTESALSFIGFGIKAPDVSLGKLISDGVNASQTRPWLFYFPGLAIIIVVLTVNFIGDGLRDALDPTQQRVRA